MGTKSIVNTIFIATLILLLVNTVNSQITSSGVLYDIMSNFSEGTPEPTSIGINFTNASVDENTFNESSIHLIGNGIYFYNLTQNSQEFALSHDENLLFRWIDFGNKEFSTYVGFYLRMVNENNEYKFLYIAKYYVGTFSNNSGSSLFAFKSPEIPYGQYIEYWGVETNVLFNYFNSEALKVVLIGIIHGATVSYNGPRNVYYFQPLIVDQLPNYSLSDGVFRGIRNINDTTQYPYQTNTDTQNQNQTNTDLTLDFLSLPPLYFTGIIIFALSPIYKKKPEK